MQVDFEQGVGSRQFPDVSRMGSCQKFEAMRLTANITCRVVGNYEMTRGGTVFEEGRTRLIGMPVGVMVVEASQIKRKPATRLPSRPKLIRNDILGGKVFGSEGACQDDGAVSSQRYIIIRAHIRVSPRRALRCPGDRHPRRAALSRDPNQTDVRLKRNAAIGVMFDLAPECQL